MRPWKLAPSPLLLLLCLTAPACSDSSDPPASDGPASADADTSADTSADASVDAPAPVAGTLAIDGLFDEWEGVAATVDPAGDATGDGLDVTALRVARRGTLLYLQIDLAEQRNLFTDKPDRTSLRLELRAAERRLTIDLPRRSSYLDGDVNKPVRWQDLSLLAAPTFAARRHELSLDTAALGAKQGDTVQVSFSGSDQLSGPVSVPLDTAGETVERRSPDRPRSAIT